MKSKRKKNLCRGRDKHGEVQFHLQKEPLGPFVMLLGVTVYTYLSVSKNCSALFWTTNRILFISLPIPSERLSLVRTKIKYWSKSSSSLIWDSVPVVVCDWELKRLSKAAFFQLFQSIFTEMYACSLLHIHIWTENHE